MFRAWPSGPEATGATTGKKPPSSRQESTEASTFSTSPTRPSTGSFTRARSRPASRPERPAARAPCCKKRLTTVLLTWPHSTISTACMVSASVTRRPFSKRLSMARRFSRALIWGPPPCTTTRRMLCCRNAMSSAKAAFSSSLSMAWPPYLMTTVWVLISSP